jgi:hypothetical protein
MIFLRGSISPLKCVFCLLLSSWNSPQSSDLLILMMKVLEALSKQFTVQEVWEEIFQNERFPSFLENAAVHPDSFVRNAALSMMEALRQENIEYRSLLEKRIQSLLQITPHINFPLELLVIVMRDYGTSPNSPLLDPSMTGLLLSALQHCMLNSLPNARNWCLGTISEFIP